jgi:hypothetical protein
VEAVGACRGHAIPILIRVGLDANLAPRTRPSSLRWKREVGWAHPYKSAPSEPLGRSIG